MRKRIIGALTALTLAVILTAPGARARQGGTTRYVYDDNGRLTAVISPNGEAAVYDYDAAGNFTAIRRLSADTITLLAFFPHEGGAGDEVTFVGTGFNAGVTSVSFSGAAAQIANVTPSALVAIVPDGATTGSITIVTPRGTLITPVAFSVVSRVRVLPAEATVLSGDTVPFTAIVGGGGDQSVIWAVNGVVGGNNPIGTISAAGLYAAPNLPGNSSMSFVVRATSVAQPALFGLSQVKVLNPNALASVLAAPVSMLKGDLRRLAAAQTPLVSVRRGVVISAPVLLSSHLVSVRRGVAISGPSAALSPLVSVNFGAAAASVATVFSPFVSVTTGPAISNVLPPSIARGATVMMTVNGANLSGSTNVRFLNSSGAIDTAVTATNLAANAEGTQLIATVMVATGATSGPRVVVVTAASGTTLAMANGPNTITIQ